MNRFLAFLAFAGTTVSCAPALGAIVEDLNSLGRTLLYTTNSDHVEQWRCLAGASPSLDRSKCTRQGKVVSFSTFASTVAAAGNDESERWRAENTKIDRAFAEVASQREQLAAEIHQLETQSPKPLDQLADLSEKYRQNEYRGEKLEAQRTQVDDEVAAASLLFAGDGWLASDKLYAFTATSQSPAPGSGVVAQFDQSFRRLEGKSYGRNAWWDVETHRVWFTDFRPRNWRDGSRVCPQGYSLLTAAGYHKQTKAALRQLARAYDAGETGFEQRPDGFWGWQVPVTDNGGLAYPTGYLYHPWDTAPIAQDYLNRLHPIMCVSRAPMP